MPTESATPSRWRRLWNHLSFAQLASIVTAIVLGISAIFGGLDRADHVQAAELGEPYDNGPFHLTPDDVVLVDAVPSLPELPPHCRYLVLDVTIVNVADEQVPVQSSAGVQARPDCAPASASGAMAFGLAKPNGVYVGAFRGAVERPVDVIQPGVEHGYAVVWAVPLAAVQADPDVVIRMYEMESYISTYRIARDWGRTDTRYAQLTSRVGVGS